MDNRTYKLLVVSDTHGNIDAIEKMVASEPDIHGIMHLGDGISDLMTAEIPMHIERHCVNGNCDAARGHPRTLESTFGGVGVVAAHGDSYNVKQTLTSLRSKVIRSEAPLGFFGHTHERTHSDENGVKLINPGHGARGEYLVAVFSEKGYAVEFKEITLGEQ
ncbi:MAG: YfcE family phosphodiesterase [Spirochaetota bacterium]